MRLILEIDLPDGTAELEQLASEAAASTRPARASLGMALQGALVRAAIHKMRLPTSQSIRAKHAAFAARLAAAKAATPKD